MDAVFKALADPTRRSLLDRLFREDGQSLRALEERLPMTRFGVMKHLKVLEEAGLVVPRRRGREKLHFLNPVPIRLVHDRWVSKYAEPWTATLSGLKQRLERTMEKVFEIYIKTTPERLWQAITDPEMRAKYTFGVGVFSDWTPGSRYEGIPGQPGSPPIVEGENLEVDPPHRLVQSFRALWSRDVAGHLGDREDRRLVPAGGDPRSVARGRQRRALWRLADGPLGPEDLARNRPDAHDAGIADVLGCTAGVGVAVVATRAAIPRVTAPSRCGSAALPSRTARG